MKKIKRVEVNTPKGTRLFTMRPTTDELEEGELFCDSICPYGANVCTRLPDPRYPENSDLCFCDFCDSLGETDASCSSMVPLDGEIERVFPDFPDIIKILGEEDPLIKVGEVIDSVCAGGCDLYNKDHSGCTAENSLCILKQILKDKNFGKKPKRINTNVDEDNKDTV